jgi:hypothetical protein
MEDEGNGIEDVKVLTEILTAFKKVEPEKQARLLQTVSTFLGIDLPGKVSSSPSHQPTSSPISRGSFSADRSISPKDFVLDKQPRTDVERVACIAYYLTHYRNTPHFETLDISKINTEAAQTKLSNAANAVGNAVQGGYLVAAPHGKRQISAGGERFVQALPDRDLARKAMESVRPRRQSKKVSPASSENQK